MGLGSFLFGSPEKHEQKLQLTKEQMPLFQQLLASLQGSGAGGAFGEASDYYRNILSQDPQLMQQFFAPEMRRFNQETVPGLAEQFAGMGSGALSSSGFRNASLQAGTDLQERLAALRANLMQGAAQGLSGLGQFGLNQFSKDVVTQPGSSGFLREIAPAVGTAMGGPIGTAIGGLIGSSFGKSSPYGNTPPYAGAR